MESFARDVRYVTRALLRSPAFFAVTVLTLALGVGATTAIYSVVNGVLLRPLPYPDPDRIVHLWQVGEQGGRGQVSDPNYDDWKAGTRSFSAMAQLSPSSFVSVSGTSEPVRVRAAFVSRAFFDVLGVNPIRGRLFAGEETQEDGARAVIVSHRFWQNQLGGRADLSGAAIRFNEQSYSVIGVLPPTVDFPAGTDLWGAREVFGKSEHRTGRPLRHALSPEYPCVGADASV